MNILCLVAALVLKYVLGGTISPTSSPPPIYNTLANAGVRADYRFSFKPDTFLPSGGYLSITFPSQYSTTTAFSNGYSCSVTCTGSGLTVTMTFDYDLTAGGGNANQLSLLI